MSNERTENIHGYRIHSWYNEGFCNWEAWICGVGNSTDPENRENAIVGILRRAAAAKKDWDESQEDSLFPSGANDLIQFNSWEETR